MNEIKKTPEEVKIEKVTEEYIKLCKDKQDNIGLYGYQPRLRNIRKSYRSADITELELKLVCQALATELQGERESFKSIKDFANYAFPGLQKYIAEKKRTVQPVTVLSAAEQAAIIKQTLGKSEKKPTKKKQSSPQPAQINKANLPACLRHLV